MDRRVRTAIASETITRELLDVYGDCKASLEHPDLKLYTPEECAWVKKKTPFMEKLEEAYSIRDKARDKSMQEREAAEKIVNAKPSWGMGRTRKHKRRPRKTRRSHK